MLKPMKPAAAVCQKAVLKGEYRRTQYTLLYIFCQFFNISFDNIELITDAENADTDDASMHGFQDSVTTSEHDETEASLSEAEEIKADTVVDVTVSIPALGLSVEDRFAGWLSKNNPSLHISEPSECISEIEKYCVKKTVSSKNSV